MILVLGFIWTLYSAVFWISGTSLRLRLVVGESARKFFLSALFIVALVQWLWQCYYLR